MRLSINLLTALFDHILVDVIAVFDVFTSGKNMDIGTVQYISGELQIRPQTFAAICKPQR